MAGYTHNGQSLALRPITPADRPFLARLYASTRQDELALLDWDDAQKESFLEMQFNAQHTFYTEQFRQAQFEIIELEGDPIGRLYLDRRPDEIRLIDIALLPEQRGRGIGSFFMQRVLTEARLARLPVRIHVERLNPALRLYGRLGFRQIDDTGVYYLLEWTPDQGANHAG